MYRVVLILLVGVWIAAGVRAQDFVPGFEDVPILEGLTVVPDAGHVFDSPAGRLVESHASGQVTADEVRVFYRETLAALGWHAIRDDTYARNDEILTIEIQGPAADKTITVVFHLSPHRP